MRVGTFAVVAAALLGLSAVLVPSLEAKRPLCKTGRFLVQGPPLISANGASPQPVVVGEGMALIDDICPPTRAKFRRSKRGTAIVAKWGGCTGVEGKVRLKGKLDVACASLSGLLIAKKAGLRQEFAAQRSVCGDGVLDASGGEGCDVGFECGANQHCESCKCEQGVVTTTSSVPATTTTSTTCAASVDFDGASAPDYLMFSGMETSQQDEFVETSNCDIVTSPVRSGARACQVAFGAFTALRPQRFSESTLFVRVYHRIDVTTAPSQLAFEPVIVTDVIPLGISAADVGVDTDGSIRYRLRNRLQNTDLGESPPLPAGVWRRIELRTTVGTSTTDGSAELRIDGVPVVTANNQNFAATEPPPPLDSAFISHNPNIYEGAHGGVWTATFDDIAVTRNDFPGAGRVIARQGRTGAPSSNDWSLVGADSIAEAWSDSPADGTRRAETPATGDPLAQTMLVAPFGQGVDPICVGNVVKACQTWVFTRLDGTPADRTYASRRRIGGATTDVPLPGECGGATMLPACLSPTFGGMQSDALQGTFWTATLDELNAAEIGAVKSGGAGGAGLRVSDVWLSCEYQ